MKDNDIHEYVTKMHAELYGKTKPLDKFNFLLTTRSTQLNTEHLIHVSNITALNTVFQLTTNNERNIV